VTVLGDTSAYRRHNATMPLAALKKVRNWGLEALIPDGLPPSGACILPVGHQPHRLRVCAVTRRPGVKEGHRMILSPSDCTISRAEDAEGGSLVSRQQRDMGNGRRAACRGRTTMQTILEGARPLTAPVGGR
jgi:hypothetical protein